MNIPRLGYRLRLDSLIAKSRREDVVLDLTGQAVDLGVPIRCDAVRALAELDDPRALESVANAAVYDREAHVRQEAGSALVSVLQRMGVPKLGDRSRDVDRSHAGWPAVGGDAVGPVQLARTLLLIGDPELLEGKERLLCEILCGDANADVSEVIFQEMLRELADPRPEIVERVVQRLVHHGHDHVDRLMAVLHDPARAPGAARALGEIKDNRALGALVAGLRSEDPSLRRTYVWALGELADSRAVPDLIGATSDPDYEVRKEAFSALDKLASPGVVGGVARALSTLGRELPPDRWQTLALPGGQWKNDAGGQSQDDATSGSSPAEAAATGVEDNRDVRHEEDEDHDEDEDESGVTVPADGSAASAEGKPAAAEASPLTSSPELPANTGESGKGPPSNPF